MITTVITYLLTSKIAQAIGALLVAFVAWWGNGAINRRKGRVAEQKQAAARDAKAYAETRKAIDDADADISHDPGILRDFLRARDPGVK